MSLSAGIGGVVSAMNRQYTSPAVRNLFWLFAINGSVAFLSIATKIKLANLLAPTYFGLYSYVLAISVYGTVIIRYGRERSMVRSLVQNPEKSNQTIVATVILSSGLMSIVFPILGLYILFCEPALGLGGLLIAFCSCVVSLDLQPVYDSWRKMGRHAMYHAMDRVLFMGIIWTVILCFPDRVNLSSIAVASLVGISASLFFQYREVRRVTGFRVFRREAFREASLLLRSAFPLALAMFAAAAFGPTISVFLKHYCGPAEIGIYAAAWQFVMIANFGLGQIGRIGNPAMARIARTNVSLSERRKTIGKYALVMLIAATPIAVPCVLCPELIVNTLFSSEYASAARVLPVLGGYVLLLSLGIVASQCVISMRRDRRYLTSVIIGGIVGIVSCSLLIPRYGAVGAAWGLLISHGLSMVLYISTTIHLLFGKDFGSGTTVG